MAKNKPSETPTLTFINKAISMRKAQLKHLGSRSQADDNIRMAAEADFDEAVATWEAANKAVKTFKPSDGVNAQEESSEKLDTGDEVKP